MAANFKGIVLVVICSVLAAVAQIFLKLGANEINFNFVEIVTNSYVLLGMLSYFVGMLVLMLALKRGNLNVLYPFVALSYVWVSLMAIYFLGEKLTLMHWSGILFIVAGVSFIGAGSE